MISGLHARATSIDVRSRSPFISLGFRRARRLLLVLVVVAHAQADVVRVENSFGGIQIHVVAEMEVKVGGTGRSRAMRTEDLVLHQEEGLMVVECRPADGAELDVIVNLPYGVEVEATTVAGSISLEGLIAKADLATDTGNIELRAPWRATELEIEAEQAPAEFAAPPEMTPRGGSEKWKLVYNIPKQDVSYGKIEVSARAPGAVSLVDQPIPEDAWVKLPWQAEGILEEILESTQERPADEQPTAGVEPRATEEGVFRSDVRLVNLMVSVLDNKGRPLLGLQADDFEVLEDGVPQKVESVESEEAPFNLAILLDWSGSTRKDRVAMKIAAQRFVDAARPQDRVAVYALVANLFTVISPLTEDHELIKSRVRNVPASTGASPIYDAIVLAYAQELSKLPDERNALIVLSDGIDNQIREAGALRTTTDIGRHAEGLPSKVRFDDLTSAAGYMSTLLYPVFLPPKQTSFSASPSSLRGRSGARNASIEGVGSNLKQWQLMARDRLRELARESGGRMFEAKSIRDLKPIFPLVTEELRSVYSISYYPANQTSDGSWREVTVKVVGQPKAVVRTRSGYAAR